MFNPECSSSSSSGVGERRASPNPSVASSLAGFFTFVHGAKSSTAFISSLCRAYIPPEVSGIYFVTLFVELGALVDLDDRCVSILIICLTFRPETKNY